MDNQHDISVTWSAGRASAASYRMVPTFRVRDPEIPIFSVKLSADARIAAVQRLLPSEKFESSSLEFFSLNDWSLLWRLKLPLPLGANVAHWIQPLLLGANRFVVADADMAMYDGNQLQWRTEYPQPNWPSDHYIAVTPERWRVVSSSVPVIWNNHFLVHVRWARKLGPGGDNEGVWQDVLALELVDIDGRWVRRIDVDDQRVPSEPVPLTRSPYKLLSGGEAEWRPDGELVAVLRPPQGREISAVDISLDSRRALVVLDARELVDFSLVPAEPKMQL